MVTLLRNQPQYSRDLPERLRAERVTRGLTQAQAAKVAGVGRSMYSYYETGTFPVPLHVILTLAREWDAPQLTDGIPELEKPPAEGRIPDIGDLSAGGFQEVSVNEPSYAAVPLQFVKEGNRAGRIASDSMYPTLQVGDRVIIRLNESPPTGSIVVARSDDGELIVKRLKYDDNQRLVLVGDNPNHPPTDPKKCKVIGEVIAIYHRALR